jgi:hypothetical protein
VQVTRARRARERLDVLERVAATNARRCDRRPLLPADTVAACMVPAAGPGHDNSTTLAGMVCRGSLALYLFLLLHLWLDMMIPYHSRRSNESM